MLVRLEQPWNALIPIEFTLLGIFLLYTADDAYDQPAPIEVTLLGMVMLLRLVQA